VFWQGQAITLILQDAYGQRWSRNAFSVSAGLDYSGVGVRTRLLDGARTRRGLRVSATERRGLGRAPPNAAKLRGISAGPSSVPRASFFSSRRCGATAGKRNPGARILNLLLRGGATRPAHPCSVRLFNYLGRITQAPNHPAAGVSASVSASILAAGPRSAGPALRGYLTVWISQLGAIKDPLVCRAEVCDVVLKSGALQRSELRDGQTPDRRSCCRGPRRRGHDGPWFLEELNH